jgi:protein gp37
MGGTTKIGWTDFTVNPTTPRCDHVAPECWLCYSERQTNRWYGAGTFTSGPPVLKPGRLLLPFLDNDMLAGRRGFLTSMSDPFHPGLPIEAQAQIWAMMAADRRHEYQVLTKRPHIGRKLLTDPAFPAMVKDAIGGLIKQLTPRSGRWTPKRRAAVEMAQAAAEGFRWPLPNAVVVVSAGSQMTAQKFLPILTNDIPAAVRGLSWEPSLSDTDITDWLRPVDGVDWVILGGESGRVHRPAPFAPPYNADGRPLAARPMYLSWMRSMKAQAEHAGVPVWVKQLGSVQSHMFGLEDFKGEAWDEWPEELADLKVRQHPDVELCA